MTNCSSKGSITEGKIDYAISFPDFDTVEHTFLAILLPKQQTYTFHNNLFHSSVKKAMVEINIISNTEKKYFYSDLKFSKSKFYEGTVAQEDLADFDIEFTDKRAEIAGFKAKHAIAHSNNNGKIELWYTEEIAMQNPNWHTPYSEVPGVLLEYTVINNGITMHFKATSFYDEEVDKTLFIPSKKGEQITFQEFEAELSELFGLFLKS